ncbi:uncharacterized protein LOC130948488 [Arachis stenosperma]|uniref:uncharacterized protein LOC130948488 n=1 Tax=Arachis stenosperma TaxID=217475 RepID=UPI0025ACDB29|nr:uncharacterized protein LOC130948488 [Arachis stenosperma]XP_057733220.1 uncharacterized protein LOC130948488 [Arachis stenosperma]
MQQQEQEQPQQQQQQPPLRRREEEHASLSPSTKLRSQNHLEAGPDPYRRTRPEGSDRSPVVPQRNLSPLKVDGVRRVGSGNKGVSDGFEGKDYDWHSGCRRSGQPRSRSPPVELVRKRAHFDDGTGHGNCSPPPVGLRPRYELSQTMDCCVDDENLDAKRVYGDREKEFIDSRFGGGHGIVDHKFVMRENEAGGSYRSIADMGLAPRYEETDMGVAPRYEENDGHLPPQSRSVPMARFDHERPQRRDPLPMDKTHIAASHNEAEKTMYHARGVSYYAVSPPYTKDFAGTSHIRGYGNSSIEMSRSDFLRSRGNGVYLRTSYDVPRSSGKLAEPVGFNGHGQRPSVHTSRDPEIGQRSMMCHQQCEFSPARAEHADFINSKLQVNSAQDERVYQYDDIPRRVAPHGRVDYEQPLMDYDNRELSGPYISHPDLDRTEKSEDSYGYQRRVVLHDHPPLQRPRYSDYHDMRRTSNAPTQGETYSHSGYSYPEIGKRIPQDHKVSYLGAPEVDRLSNPRSEFESRRDGGSGLHQERFHSPPLSMPNSGTYRQAVRVQEMRQDFGNHGHPDRFLKRKYNANDEADVHDFRRIRSSKWDGAEEFQDLYESEEWVDDEDMDMTYSSGDIGSNHNMYVKYKSKYNELEYDDFPSDDWILPQESMGHVQRHSIRYQKYSSQNIKHHPRASTASWYKSQQHSKRNAIHKQPKVWKKYHGYDESKHTTNDESSEDWVCATESEPTEGSEEFEQMVHEAFLMFSKRLNLNSSVYRRYRDQGKAGSLYCIVCGRSSSKEFMDTQRLVTHAFMSHKVGLRTKHLGLHRAICVLMGWDTIVPQDTVTWVPQILPHSEAMAQKEDLIIWPPITIIHNISMYDDNPQNWKVVSMETIESFLRGKGFVRGRIKLCLGKPADQSVILVKFLGTFGGLGDAERLHRYLSDNNHGRTEFERVKSEGIKSCNIKETREGDRVEKILYGYVGIAEDLDKLDFNSKKWSMVKSRKEIEDLDNAPVKPDERR